MRLIEENGPRYTTIEELVEAVIGSDLTFTEPSTIEERLMKTFVATSQDQEAWLAKSKRNRAAKPLHYTGMEVGADEVLIHWAPTDYVMAKTARSLWPLLTATSRRVAFEQARSGRPQPSLITHFGGGLLAWNTGPILAMRSDRVGVRKCFAAETAGEMMEQSDARDGDAYKAFYRCARRAGKEEIDPDERYDDANMMPLGIHVAADAHGLDVGGVVAWFTNRSVESLEESRRFAHDSWETDHLFRCDHDVLARTSDIHPWLPGIIVPALTNGPDRMSFQISAGSDRGF